MNFEKFLETVSELGLEMALEKVNRRGGVGGIPLEAVICDTAGRKEIHHERKRSH